MFQLFAWVMLGRLIDLLLEILWVVWVVLAVSAVCALPTIYKYKQRNRTSLNRLISEKTKTLSSLQVSENISIYSINKTKALVGHTDNKEKEESQNSVKSEKLIEENDDKMVQKSTVSKEQAI